MKTLNRAVSVAALLCAAAVLFVACSLPLPTVTQTQVVNVGQGPTASPSPGSGTDLPPGSSIRIGIFGQSCPSGTTAPSNGTRQIKVGCTADVTATPKDAQGNDLPAAVHGPAIAWAVPAGAGNVSCLADSNPFNRRCACSSVGVFTLEAQVKNVTGRADFECVR